MRNKGEMETPAISHHVVLFVCVCALSWVVVLELRVCVCVHACPSFLLCDRTAPAPTVCLSPPPRLPCPPALLVCPLITAMTVTALAVQPGQRLPAAL